MAKHRTKIYLIGSIHLTNGVIDEVDLCDYESLDKSPRERNRTAPVSEVIELIKAGHDVKALWYNLPVAGDPEATTYGTIPLELVTQPDGSESFEVMQRGQPESYRSVMSLPAYEEHWTAPGFFEKGGGIPGEWASGALPAPL